MRRLHLFFVVALALLAAGAARTRVRSAGPDTPIPKEDYATRVETVFRRHAGFRYAAWSRLPQLEEQLQATLRAPHLQVRLRPSLREPQYDPTRGCIDLPMPPDRIDALRLIHELVHAANHAGAGRIVPLDRDERIADFVKRFLIATSHLQRYEEHLAAGRIETARGPWADFEREMQTYVTQTPHGRVTQEDLRCAEAWLGFHADTDDLRRRYAAWPSEEATGPPGASAPRGK